MSLKERIEGEVTQALKSGMSQKAGVLRFVIAQIKNRELEKRAKSGSDVLTDDEVMEVLQKEAKKRIEAIALFRQGNRNDLAEKEEAELLYVQSYLPAQATREEVVAAVKKLKEGGAFDFPSLMKAAMAELKGKADGTVVSAVVKEVLSQ